MHQRERVRCPYCHHWTDALLIWAAGDCCPFCNTPMTELGEADQRSTGERSLRPPPGLPGSRPDRFGESDRIFPTR